MRSLMEWWRAQEAVRDLHQALSRTPDWSQWRIPCDTSKPNDVIVARTVMLLQQKYPDVYRVLWSAKNLTIYRTANFEAVVSVPHRETLSRWGLLQPPRRDSEGIHSPPPQAGGVAFPNEVTK